MRQTLEQQLEKRVSKAKDAVKLKYFKQFCSAKSLDERLEINARMDALDSVVYDLIKNIKTIDN